MQHDLFHVYTVDQHILMVLRNVPRFLIPEHAHEYPFCSQLAAQFYRPYVLYVAALFHDVAKGRGGDHSDLGAKEVRRFCRDHDIDGDDAALIEFLVKSHLTMSRIAQKEDLSDPEVIESFVELVGAERRLTALYLLTVADIRGTSPKVWNAWKSKLLEDLFRNARRVLREGGDTAENQIAAKQRDALRIVRQYAIGDAVHASFWSKLDDGYFQRFDASEIAWHTRVLAGRVESTKAIVRARLSPVGEGIQVLIYSRNQEALFA